MPDGRIDIPNIAGWPELPLRELCVLISRGTAPVYVERSDVMAVGQRCVTAHGFDASKARPHSERVMSGALHPEVGDVLLNSTGTGTIGRSCLFEHSGSFVLDGHVTDLRPSSRVLDGRWLNAMLRSSWGQRRLECFCYSGSTNQVELNRLPLGETRVPTPPLDEQRAAAQILDTLDITIRQTEAIVEKLKQVKQGLLNDLLTRGIDANGELRSPQSEAPHLYKESPLGWIPRAWSTTTLAALTSIRSGTTPARRAAARYYHADGTPWVKTLDLNEDIIYSTDEHITDAALRECSCEELPVGTVLVAMYGGWQQIGRSAMLGMPAATNQAVSALVFGSGGPHPEYVLRAMQHARPRWGAVAASTRKDPNITKSDVAEFRIPLPLEFEEQVRIAETVRALLIRIDSEQDAVSKLMQKRTGLMDDLLTGRVRVTPLLD